MANDKCTYATIESSVRQSAVDCLSVDHEMHRPYLYIRAELSRFLPQYVGAIFRCCLRAPHLLVVISWGLLFISGGGDGAAAQSLKCDPCQAILKDVTAAELHAHKVGHGKREGNLSLTSLPPPLAVLRLCRLG